MRNSSKIVALLLCLSLLLSAMTIFASAEAEVEEQTPTTSVEPNYTAANPTSGSQFTTAVKSDMEGNVFNSTVNVHESWYVVDTADGNQFVYFNTVGAAYKALIDIAPPTGETYFKDYPTFIVEYELIKIGACDSVSQTFLARTTGTSGYTINTGISMPNLLAGVNDGELAKISIAFQADAATNTVHMYAVVNGEVKFKTYHTYADAETFNNSYIHGYRMLYSDTDSEGNARVGTNLIVDNIYAKHFAPDVTDVLDSEGRVNEQYSQFARAEHKSVALPAIATVDGVEYYSVDELNMAISGSSTAPEVVFLNNYTLAPWLSGKVVVASNAVVNTNGFITADDLDLSGATRYTVDGNTITVIAPNYSKVSVDFKATSGHKAFGNAIKSPVSGNEGINIGTSLGNGSSEGQFTVYSHANNSFGTITRVTEGITERVNVQFASTPKFSEYQFAMMQFEYAFYSESGAYGTLAPTFIVNGGADGVSLTNGNLFTGMTKGEVAQFTVLLYGYDNGDGTSTYGYYVYRNGEYLCESVRTSSYGVDKIYVRELRRENCATSVIIGNVYTRHFTTDPRTLAEDGKTLLALEGDQFASEEFVTMLPSIATVNGVEYNSVPAINAAIEASEGAAQVEFFHDYANTPWGTAKVTVNGNATIKTGGYITADDLTFGAGYDCIVNGNTIVTHLSNWAKTSLAGVSGGSANTKANDAVKVPYGAELNLQISFYKSDDKYTINEYNGNKFISAKALEKAANDNQDDKQPRYEIYYKDYSNYKYSQYNYMIMQFDSAYFGDTPKDGSIRPISMLPGVTEAVFNNKALYAGLKSGEVAQFTFMLYVIPYQDNAETEDIDESLFGDYYIAVYRNGDKISDSLAKSNIDLTATYSRQLRVYQANAHLAFDNIFVTHYTTDPRVEVDGKVTFVNDQFTNPEYTQLVLPPVALIDGVEASYDEAEALLADGGTHTVELLHNPIRTLTVASNSTISTYGYTGIALGEGYLMTEADGVVTVSADARTTNINLAVNGEVVMTLADVRYAINHEEYVRALDSLAHSANVFVKDGKYYALTWDFTKPEYDEEITYNATATLHPLLVVDESTGAVVSDRLVYDENGVLIEGSFANLTTIVYFNEDIASSAAANKLTFGNTYWAMNGYAYNYTASAENVHGIVVADGTEFVIANGTFNITGGSSFFYSMENTAPTLVIADTTINTYVIVADWRAGTLTLNNCEINGGRFGMGARTGTDTYITFNGGSITADLGNGSLISYTDNNVFGYGQGELALLPNVDRNVTFNGTKINLIGGLVSMGNDAVDVAEGDFNKRVVTFTNCEIHANSVGVVMNGKVVFGDNVKYSIVNDLDKIEAAEGVMLGVKTNEIGIGAIATKDYATVIWAEGVVEYWADGSVPAAPGAEYAALAVGPVVAGETYTFEATTGASESYELNVNLTLSESLFYNIYAEDALSVTVNGTALELVDGRYTFELLAKYALGELDIVITFADGSVYSKATSLMEYVTKSAAEYAEDTALLELYAAMLNYIVEVQTYEVAPLAYAEAVAFATQYAPAALEITSVETGALATYLKSAFFYLDGQVDLVFMVQDGYILGDVTVTAGEFTAVVHTEDEFLVMTLPVYALSDAIELTLTIDGEAVTVVYGLGNYVNGVANTGAGDVVSALYSYANAAKLYMAQQSAE